MRDQNRWGYVCVGGGAGEGNEAIPVVGASSSALPFFFSQPVMSSSAMMRPDSVVVVPAFRFLFLDFFSVCFGESAVR